MSVCQCAPTHTAVKKGLDRHSIFCHQYRSNKKAVLPKQAQGERRNLQALLRYEKIFLNKRYMVKRAGSKAGLVGNASISSYEGGADGSRAD